MTTITITSRWKTVRTLGFAGCVSRYLENRAAHGGVRHIQLRRRVRVGIIARQINVNGTHLEVGDEFVPTHEQVERWTAAS